MWQSSACSGKYSGELQTSNGLLHDYNYNVAAYYELEDFSQAQTPIEHSSISTRAMSRSVNGFSRELFQHVLAAGDQNPVISSLSVYYVLSMISFGAQNNTLYELEQILGHDFYQIALALYTLTNNLANTRGSTSLNLAGSVWVADDFAINPNFVNAVDRYFGSSVYSRTLYDEATITEINDWVYYQTEGLIEEFLDSVDSDAVILLLNTLYLNTSWRSNFNPMTESKDMFRTYDGTQVESAFLSTGDFLGMNIAVTDYYEAVFLPYDDWRLGFFMVRPTDGTCVRDFYLHNNLLDIFDSLEFYSTTKVKMPALDKEFDIDLADLLEEIGLVGIFDGNLADLSALAKFAMEDNLFLSQLRQTARIIVNKYGTEAAAVTVAEVVPQSMPLPPADPITLIFNTPFIYFIYDRELNIILFAGVVDDPSL